MILVISAANNVIFFSHMEKLDSRQHVHQSSLLGHCVEEQNSLIFSIGEGEQVIKTCQVQNNVCMLVKQIQMDQQFRQIQFSCAIKCNTSMLITTNTPNQLIDINIPSIIGGGMAVNGIKFGQYGGKQN